jgi:hypothetical protein
MTTCAGTKRNGQPCTAEAPIGSLWCYHHDPARAEERSRKASHAATIKHSHLGGELRSVRELIRKIVCLTLEDRLRPAAVES